MRAVCLGLTATATVFGATPAAATVTGAAVTTATATAPTAGTNSRTPRL